MFECKKILVHEEGGSKVTPIGLTALWLVTFRNVTTTTVLP